MWLCEMVEPRRVSKCLKLSRDTKGLCLPLIPLLSPHTQILGYPVLESTHPKPLRALPIRAGPEVLILHI